MATKITAPYDELTLKIALMTASQKMNKVVEEKGQQYFQDAIMEIMASNPPPTEETTIRAAKHFGVSPKELIDSPNYTELMREYVLVNIRRIVAATCAKFGLTDKEGWAVCLSNKLEFI